MAKLTRITFEQWLEGLAEVTRNWMNNHQETSMDEAARHGYYEGQPEAWEGHWEDGETPEEAMLSDMEYWDE